jgi:hypothetical protein
MQDWQIRLSPTLTELAVTRVENGWLIRTDSRFERPSSTPLMVAETPEKLSEIVMSWAVGQSMAMRTDGSAANE